MIIGQKTFEERAAVLEYMVSIAHELTKMANYFSLEVFSNALSSKEVRRAGMLTYFANVAELSLPVHFSLSFLTLSFLSLTSFSLFHTYSPLLFSQLQSPA